jgi:hypothetical protein
MRRHLKTAIPLTRFRRELRKLLKGLGDRPLIVTAGQRGAVAVVLSPSEYVRLTESDRNNKQCYELSQTEVNAVLGVSDPKVRRPSEHNDGSLLEVFETIRRLRSDEDEAK